MMVEQALYIEIFTKIDSTKLCQSWWSSLTNAKIFIIYDFFLIQINNFISINLLYGDLQGESSSCSSDYVMDSYLIHPADIHKIDY